VCSTDITDLCKITMLISKKELSTGWKLKESGDSSEDAWMPVSKVPTVVHLDLMENGKYVVKTQVAMTRVEFVTKHELT